MSKIPSYRIDTVAEAIAPNAKQEVIGIRPGEKLHEEMITSSDSYNTIDIGKYYVVLPIGSDVDKYLEHYGGKRVEPGFTYSSNNNDEWVGVEEMRELIRTYVDLEFVPFEEKH